MKKYILAMNQSKKNTPVQLFESITELVHQRRSVLQVDLSLFFGRFSVLLKKNIVEPGKEKRLTGLDENKVVIIFKLVEMVLTICFICSYTLEGIYRKPLYTLINVTLLDLPV